MNSAQRRKHERKTKPRVYWEEVVSDTKCNVHHIINRCRKNEGYNVEDTRNKILIPIITHDKIHRLFENRTPKEILTFVRGLVQTVVSEETDALLREILKIDRRDFYVDGIVR